MHVSPALDRGIVDARAEWRVDFVPPAGTVTHLVDGAGNIAAEGDRLWARPGGGPWLLGETGDGVVHCAELVEEHAALVPLRSVAPVLSDDDALLAAQAVALAKWHTMDRFCAGCGAPVETIEAGWATNCSGCGRTEYPRTDPAVIVLVTDQHDRALLAHNTLWPNPQMMSLPAGFVEAGETPTRAVARELHEEVGVLVDNIQYLAAQPWPGPRSLMLGFSARAKNSTIVPDGVEIDRARYFSREEYLAALQSGEVNAPGRAAIANAILSAWLGQPLPETPWEATSR